MGVRGFLRDPLGVELHAAILRDPLGVAPLARALNDSINHWRDWAVAAAIEMTGCSEADADAALDAVMGDHLTDVVSVESARTILREMLARLAA